MNSRDIQQMHDELNALHEKYDFRIHSSDLADLNVQRDMLPYLYEHVLPEFKQPGVFHYVTGMYKVFKKGESRQTILNEGIKSFNDPASPDFIKEQLWYDGLMLDITNMDVSSIVDNDGIPSHIVMTIKRGEITNGVYERLCCIMNHCGYYLAYKRQVLVDNINSTMFQFEPYYWQEKHEVIDMLYHVTSVAASKNILEKGFIPCSTNDVFNYPPRVYFFIDYPDAIKFESFARTNRKVNKNKEFAVLIVNSNDVTATFFTDPNMPAHAVYTYDIIEPIHIQNQIIQQIK